MQGINAMNEEQDKLGWYFVPFATTLCMVTFGILCLTIGYTPDAQFLTLFFIMGTLFACYVSYVVWFAKHPKENGLDPLPPISTEKRILKKPAKVE
jgi:hypothetical protein